MSAEVLQEAAALMRERAEAASEQSPSPWRSLLGLQVRGANGTVACWDCCGGAPHLFEDTQDHIASWHPAVALAVAELLEFAATYGSWRQHIGDGPTADLIDRAYTLASAYLDDPS